MKKTSAYLSLFTSTSTLICCALPSLLVSLGLGASMVGVISYFPQIIWLSKYKAWVFGISGVLICFAVLISYKAQSMACPIDPELAEACKKSKDVSFYILGFSILIWCTGAFFAFVAPYI